MVHTQLGVVFPGQGSQSVGMLREFSEPQVLETFAEASSVLGYDLWQLVQEGPEEKLNHTEYTQPAMLAAGVATWHLWRSQGGVLPARMAGHSLGEYTALVCAEAIDFKEAILLVADRGRYMQEAVPEEMGAMAAILGLGEELIASACAVAAEGEVVAPVNLNAPGQIVIAGHRSAVLRAIDQAKKLGAKRAVLLPVSVPSHCFLMMEAAQKLRARLEKISFSTPKIPVINNVDVAMPTEPSKIRDALARQLHSPVRWVECVQIMAKAGIAHLIECGPGKILSGLNKRIEKGIETYPLSDPNSLRNTLERFAK
ncbi:(acyl-carrier-protein) S-malonyltransferase [Gammaproteobacteria bacterium]